MIRFIINSLAYFLPSWSARLSYNAWTKTFRYPRPKRELACYQKARKLFVQIKQQKVAVYHWGESGPKILLLHGWNGRATQFCVLIEGLLDAGYSVVGFDQPGFGDSEGSHSGLLPIRQAISSIVESEGLFHAVVGHSFGWLTAINSKPETFCQCLIGIAPPADFNWLLEGFGKHFRLNVHAINALKCEVRNKYDISSLDDISMSASGPKLTLPGLIIYDSEDAKIPVEQIQLIQKHWPNAQLHVTQGLGHTRLLYHEDLMQMIVKYLNNANH